MKTLRLAFLSLVAAVLFASGVPAAEYPPLTIDSYMRISVSRLQELLASYKRSHREPLDAFWRTFYADNLTTREEYMKFSSAHAKEIRSYLDTHKLMKDEINDLATEIETAVRQLDGLPPAKNVKDRPTDGRRN